MAGRQNLLYTVFFSQTYLTTTLVYLGLGASAVVVLAIKQVITTLAHSSIHWDRPLYWYKGLHPVAWVVERFISTPATHHAHHADTNDDGIGHYKGNFGNMFFPLGRDFRHGPHHAPVSSVIRSLTLRRRRMVRAIPLADFQIFGEGKRARPGWSGSQGRRPCAPLSAFASRSGLDCYL